MASRSSTYAVPATPAARPRAGSRRSPIPVLGALLLFTPGGLVAQDPPTGVDDRDPCRLVVVPARAGEPERTVPACESTAKGGKWTLQRVAATTADLRSFDAEEAAGRLAAALEGEGRPDESDAVRAARNVFASLSFHEMDQLGKAGRVDANVSDLLGRGRREMIREAMAETLRQLRAERPDARFVTGILDSGNKNSGIASDIDQTLVVLPADPNTPAGVTPAEAIAKFEAVFEERFDFAPARMEVETIDGRDFFPDWRAEHHTVETFTVEAKRVVTAKSENDALYRTEGELQIQAAGRGWAELQRHFEALETLDRRLAELDASADLPEAERSAERARLEEERRTLLDRSPWTELELDERTGEIRETRDRDPRERGFLPNEPEVARRYAFDGSYDNWLMFESHPENRPKYLLRSVADGVGLLTSLRAEDGRYDLDRPWEARTVEYETLVARGAEETKRQFIRDIYGYLDANGGTGLDTDRIGTTLEVASRVRLKHKREPGFGDLTEAQIYAEYMPEARHPEHADEWRKLPDATRLEIAKRAWEVDARELMIENLLRTIRQPGDILAGGIDPREFAEIRAKYPGAAPEKLKKAAWLQLFHGFRDLMTHEHARAIGQAIAEGRGALGAAPGGESGRMTDLVDRMIAELSRVQGPAAAEARAEIEKVLIDAAASKLELQPDPADRDRLAPAVAEAFLEAMRTRLQSGSEFKAEFDRVRLQLREGRYEDTRRRVLQGVAHRYANFHASLLNTLGFNGEILLHTIDPDGLPEIEVRLDENRPWDVRKALWNLTSIGNVEATVSVLQAYQEGGASAAARQLILEIVMEVAPGADWVMAGREAALDDNYRPLFMTATGMAMPIVGQAYAVVSIVTGTAQLVGKAILQPLANDRMDMAYQGFLGAENDRINDERGQRVSVLSPLPVRVIPVNETDNDGNPLTRYVHAEYSRAEVLALLGARGSTGEMDLEASDEEYEQARAAGVIGGGEEYRALESRANDWFGEPRLAFEARRASLWHHYRDNVEDYLRTRHAIDDVEMLLVERGASDAVETLRPFFSDIVADWAYGRGEFEAVVGGENELMLPWTPADRQQFLFGIGRRMAADFIGSYRIVALHPIQMEAGLVDASIEGQMVQEIWQVVDAERRRESQRLAAAIEDAYDYGTDREIARAIREIILKRRDALRQPAPRVHVRARVVDGATSTPTAAGAGSGAGSATAGNNDPLAELTERIEFDISVIADPDSLPPPYRANVAWTWTDDENETALAATVRVFAGNGLLVGDSTRVEIGTLLYEPPEMIARPEVETRIAADPEAEPPIESVEGTVAPDEGVLVYDDVRVFFTPERDLSKPFRWRIVHVPTDEQVAGGVWDPDSIELTENTPRAEEGAPGLFVAQPRLWSRPAGTYAVQSCEPQLSDQLLGQGGHGGCADEWQDEGSFEAATRRLRFQRFVVEPGSAPLADGGSWMIRTDPDGGTRVAIDATATTADGSTVDLGRVVLDLPDVIDPQQAVSGQIDAELANPIWDLGAELFELVPTRAATPDPSLIAPDLLSHRVPPGAGTTWSLRITPYDDAVGRPAAPFSDHIRDDVTAWLIPVRLTQSAGQPLHGYAVYGSRQVTMAEADQDEDGEAMAEVVDAGSADVRVEDVSGLSAAEAKRRLEAQGLQPEFVVGAAAPSEATAHTVASQTPAASAGVAPGSAVRVTLRGPFVEDGTADADRCEALLAAAYLAYAGERWDAAIDAYDEARDAGCGERAETGLADAERRRDETEALARSWEEEQRRQADAEAERQRQAAEEAERQRQAAEEAERQRQAAEEAERQRQAAEAAERQRQAEEEAERQRRAAEERRQRADDDALRRVQEDLARACEPIDRGNSAYRAGRLPEALQLYRQAWDARCESQELADRITWIETELDRQAEEQRRQADAWAREQDRRRRCMVMLDQLRRAVDAGQNVQAMIAGFGAALGDCRGPELDAILRGAGGGPPPAPPQQLDDVVVPSAVVTITVWDHGSEDDDYVTIWVNGYVMLNQYRLTNRQRSFQARLDPSRPNEIRILAHNEGTSSPNTAALTVSPASHGGSQTWNLRTNQTAIARVIVR